LYSNSKKHPESPDPCSNEPSNMNSSPEAMARQAADAETPKSSIMTKVLGKWSVLSLGLAMSIGVFAFYMGASRPDPERVSYGDPSCWVGGFRPEYCCFGPGGNSNCWDETHTYDRCCLGRHDEVDDE